MVKEMKKWIALLLSFVMALSLCACGNGNTSIRSATDSEQEEDESTDDEFELYSDFTIKLYVENALRNEIKEYMSDVDSFRANINKTEKESGYIYVYGTVTLYDKYGNLTDNPFRSYTVRINTSTRNASCDIK